MCDRQATEYVFLELKSFPFSCCGDVHSEDTKCDRHAAKCMVIFGHFFVLRDDVFCGVFIYIIDPCLSFVIMDFFKVRGFHSFAVGM